MRWFTKNWWKYLLAKKDESVPWTTVIYCRMRRHPNGIVWYNPGGDQPDYHCRHCNDYLG